MYKYIFAYTHRQRDLSTLEAPRLFQDEESEIDETEAPTGTWTVCRFFFNGQWAEKDTLTLYSTPKFRQAPSSSARQWQPRSGRGVNVPYVERKNGSRDPWLHLTCFGKAVPFKFDGRSLIVHWAMDKSFEATKPNYLSRALQLGKQIAGPIWDSWLIQYPVSFFGHLSNCSPIGLVVQFGKAALWCGDSAGKAWRSRFHNGCILHWRRLCFLCHGPTQGRHQAQETWSYNILVRFLNVYALSSNGLVMKAVRWKTTIGIQVWIWLGLEDRTCLWYCHPFQEDPCCRRALCIFFWFSRPLPHKIQLLSSYLYLLDPRFVKSNFPNRCMFENILDFVKDSDQPFDRMKLVTCKKNLASFATLLWTSILTFFKT